MLHENINLLQRVADVSMLTSAKSLSFQRARTCAELFKNLSWPLCQPLVRETRGVTLSPSITKRGPLSLLLLWHEVAEFLHDAIDVNACLLRFGDVWIDGFPVDQHL
jgi:hypothetical protein